MGTLPWGTADPDEHGFDDRLFVASTRSHRRGPHPLGALTFADPSSHPVLVPRADGTLTYAAHRAIAITAFADGEVPRTAGFDWEDWNLVTCHERRKARLGVLATAFDRARAPPNAA